MNNPFFSVIIPVYKVEKYLHQCVDSILSQSFLDFEIILVDDGSPDGCPAICDAYARRDQRIRVIHQKNGGVSSARNAGLMAANGTYIIFLDSDDYHLSNSLEQLYNNIISDLPDICCFGVQQEVVGGIRNHVSKNYSGVLTDELLLSVAYAGFVRSNIAMIDVSSFNKAYKAAIVKQARLSFDTTLRLAEDITFNVQYLCNCTTVKCIDSILYFYRNTPHSATHADTGFAEKGMERSVYFLSKIQKALEQRIASNVLLPVAKSRYNRIVIDACCHNHKSTSSRLEKLRRTQDYISWYKKYLALYNVSLQHVKTIGKKAQLEDFLLTHSFYRLINFYTWVIDQYRRCKS